MNAHSIWRDPYTGKRTFSTWTCFYYADLFFLGIYNIATAHRPGWRIGPMYVYALGLLIIVCAIRLIHLDVQGWRMHCEWADAKERWRTP